MGRLLEIIANVLATLLGILLFLFPIWVGIHAGRKGQKNLALLIYFSMFVPFLPILIALPVFFKAKPFRPNLDFIPNPKAYMGCGTKFYGHAQRGQHGDFVTTQWFTLLYVPIFPIQSYRVLRQGEQTKNWGAQITTTTFYSVLEVLPLAKLDIAKTYGFLLSFPLLLIPLVRAAGPAVGQTGAVLLLAYIIVGAFLLRAK